MDTSPPPIANVITLGTQHVPALRDFYQRLGWPLIIDDQDFAAFEPRGACGSVAGDWTGEPG